MDDRTIIASTYRGSQDIAEDTVKQRPLLWIIAALVCVGILAAPASAEPADTEAAGAGQSRTMHYTVNLHSDDDYTKAASLGYNLLDVGMDEDAINSLPAGVKAIVWAGNTMCDDWDMPFEEFAAGVESLKNNTKVFAYYISDEPNTTECPQIVDEIRKRADLIKATAPRQKSLISVGWEDWGALKPSITHVDYFGVNPYPCRTENPQCDFGLIENNFKRAVAAGLPKQSIVPTYQVFGQACSGGENAWRLPNERELIKMLLIWHRLHPNPAFTYTYTWGNQEGTSCPTLVDADGTKGQPNLQLIMRLHNKWKGGGRTLEDTLNNS